jgi:hypothetical protein
VSQEKTAGARQIVNPVVASMRRKEPGRWPASSWPRANENVSYRSYRSADRRPKQVLMTRTRAYRSRDVGPDNSRGDPADGLGLRALQQGGRAGGHGRPHVHSNLNRSDETNRIARRSAWFASEPQHYPASDCSNHLARSEVQVCLPTIPSTVRFSFCW